MRLKLSTRMCKVASLYARGKIQGLRSPMTDQEIYDVFKSYNDATLTDVSLIAKLRHRYNNGTGKFFKRFGPAGQVPEMPVWKKYEKDSTGEYIEVKERPARRRQRSGGSFSTEALQALIRSEVARCSAPVIHVHIPNKPTHTLPAGTVHYKFQEAMDIISAGLNLYLVGPAGCGKSTLGKNIAKALGRKFGVVSMSEGATEAQLYGRSMPGDGGKMEFVPGPFTVAFQTGRVFLLDEIDASDSNMLLSLNAAIDNGILSIPFLSADPIDKHPDFVCIAAANTNGQGADRKYVGRNKLDGATLDRFLLGTLELDYDQTLERSIATAILKETPDLAQTLLDWAWAARSRIAQNGLERLLSTRCIRDAANLMRIGKSLEQVQNKFFQSWRKDEVQKVR